MRVLEPGAGPPGGPYGPPRLIGTTVPEGGRTRVTDQSRRLRSAWVEDVSPPPHRFGTDQPTRYRFICEHRNGTRAVTVTYARLVKLYDEAMTRRRPEIWL
jgi:hypothetical protein